MNHFFESIINLFFPPKCPFCGKVLDAVGVCSKCEKDLPWVPEEEVAFTEKDLTCAAPLWYEGAVREALLRLKFRGGSALAEPFGELLARCAAERFGGEFDTVTWVPVSQKRLEARGYDQSRLLAEAVCRHWDTRPVQLLNKVQDNPAQSGLQGEAARRANVLGVYGSSGPGADPGSTGPAHRRYPHHRSHFVRVCSGTAGQWGRLRPLSDGSKNAKTGEKGKKFTDSVLQSGKSTRIIENV